MLYAGSDDGVYRIDGLSDGQAETTQVLSSDRVYRVRTFSELPGVFAAATEDVYHSPDGENWTALGVPTDHDVNAVGATPDGEVLLAGTYPAHVYALEEFDGAATAESDAPSGGDWSELEGFLELPAREDWGLPRHDFQCHVRSIRTHPDAPDRIAVGVEVGGVHVSEDRGESWAERREGTHDDVHHLAQGDPETFVTATGFGLYRSDDAGRSWERLDDDPEREGEERREYFREALVHDGDVYACAAHGPSPTWSDDDDPALFVSRDGGPLERVASPAPEVVIGWTVADGDVVGATYAGTLLRETAEGFEVVGEVPTPGDVRGRYLQLAWIEN